MARSKLYSKVYKLEDSTGANFLSSEHLRVLDLLSPSCSSPAVWTPFVMPLSSTVQLLFAVVFLFKSSANTLTISTNSTDSGKVSGAYNCDGSAFCDPLINAGFNMHACLNQSANYKSSNIYKNYTSYAGNGCTAIFRCYDAVGYSTGVNGSDVLRA